MAEVADRVFPNDAARAGAAGAGASRTGAPAAGAPGDHIERHKGIDRLFHWLTAASVLTLMATGLLPALGIKFNWVVVHWSVGVFLTALVLFHIIRATLWQRLKCVFSITVNEIKGKRVLKYSVAQKLMHYAMTFMVTAAVITGCFMLMKMDTPLWKRDPYTLSQATWGLIYVIHGSAAVLAIMLVFIHIYFALLPEKAMYLRAMIKGWMTREETIAHHENKT